ncbi:class II aldolase/adducin family protein, partial [Acidithiobacillus ferrooxidans F221]|nr:class II aldolase/adducin family protein [Acidithiobacillus ferrooxidans F221]
MTQEGVIKFQLDWHVGPVIACALRATLGHWRDVLHAHG